MNEKLAYAGAEGYKPVDELKQRQPREVNVGDVVIWHSPKGVAHNALVQTVWSPVMLNVVVISSDESKQDSFGRQIEHYTSCGHKSMSTVHGNYWRFADEEPNQYQPPQAV